MFVYVYLGMNSVIDICVLCVFERETSAASKCHKLEVSTVISLKYMPI